MKDSEGRTLSPALEQEQAEYLADHEGNPCSACGTGNPGTIMDMPNGGQALLHYGMKRYEFYGGGKYSVTCTTCRRVTYGQKEEAR